METEMKIRGSAAEAEGNLNADFDCRSGLRNKKETKIILRSDKEINEYTRAPYSIRYNPLIGAMNSAFIDDADLINAARAMGFIYQKRKYRHRHTCVRSYHSFCELGYREKISNPPVPKALEHVNIGRWPKYPANVSGSYMAVFRSCLWDENYGRHLSSSVLWRLTKALSSLDAVLKKRKPRKFYTNRYLKNAMRDNGYVSF